MASSYEIPFQIHCSSEVKVLVLRLSIEVLVLVLVNEVKSLEISCRVMLFRHHSG